MSDEYRRIYEFGPYRLDPTERVLWWHDQNVPLTGKAFNLLLLLVRSDGGLLRREEILQQIWPGVSVEDSNLTVSVSALRKTLGENKRDNRFISTVPRIGYRFVAKVHERLVERQQHKLQRDEAAWHQLADDRTIESLAVFPFVVKSRDDELDYLSEGVAESVMSSLSKSPGLRVMAYFRVRGRDSEALKVAQRLGVQAILRGTIDHTDGQLAVNVKLRDASDGTVLFEEKYSCDEGYLLALQEEMSKRISERCQPQLVAGQKESQKKNPTLNAEAFRLYLKGRYFWNKYTFEQMERSIEYFKRAIELDPNYALAYTGLADTYVRLSNIYLPPKRMLPLAKAAAQRAVEVDERLAEAHAALGSVKLYCDHDWRGAEMEFRRAIELDDTFALAYRRLGGILMFQRKFDQALELHERAYEFDPLSLQGSVSVSMNLFFMGRTNEAILRLQSTLEMEPEYHPARSMLGWVFGRQGMFEESKRELRLSFKQGRDYTALAFLACTCVAAGEIEEAEAILKDLEAKRKRRYVSPYLFVIINAKLMRTDEAFKWLEISYEDQNEWLAHLHLTPELGYLRSDSRFIELSNRIGFHPAVP
ncbi:MAG TPA: winged helix-turn-helix domain-containing protein [Pyrinomonadaceae bacterium]